MLEELVPLVLAPDACKPVVSLDGIGAALVVHAKVDAVLGRAMQLLEIPIPAYRRTDKLLVSHQTVAELSAASGAGARRRLCFELSSGEPWSESDFDDTQFYDEDSDGFGEESVDEDSDIYTDDPEEGTPQPSGDEGDSEEND